MTFNNSFIMMSFLFVLSCSSDEPGGKENNASDNSRVCIYNSNIDRGAVISALKGIYQINSTIYMVDRLVDFSEELEGYIKYSQDCLSYIHGHNLNNDMDLNKDDLYSNMSDFISILSFLNVSIDSFDESSGSEKK
ncbi:hypothetical protein SIN8267_02932 [Sinobacterium norvegicum]|uniref:Lipoprotein n=1 Tax=Sinobacterium norvegicum TaxID=1641715 RepID=A0ABN8EK70_9GAMM|nr:hypothetical protein [Sinobacterium norvegicum]CAH0992795.1 hypothetical protein SIN8267_02932 [Sinobacterium norvegicum]